MSSKALVFLALISLLSSGVQAGDEPAATPYRPTVSNPAVLPEPGWLELEFGLQRVSGGEEKRRDGAPFLVKYAFDTDWGILLGGDLHARFTGYDQAIVSGYGDTTLTLKHHRAISDDLALGVEVGFKSPTAKTGLGSGKTDYTVNGIVSAGLGETQLDLNLGVTRLGKLEETLGRNAYGWAASVSHPVADRWTAAGEVSGTARHGARGSGQFLAALGYEWNQRLVLDGGFALGMGSTSPDWSVFAGVTLLWEKVLK
jgi:hypothetical protein